MHGSWQFTGLSTYKDSTKDSLWLQSVSIVCRTCIALNQKGEIMNEKKLGPHVRLGLTEYQKSEIERIAKVRDMSQQKVMRMLIDVGLDCHQEMEKLGVIAAVNFSHYVKESVKKRLTQSGKKQLSLI